LLAPEITLTAVTMKPSEVIRKPEPRLIAGCSCVTTVTTAGLALAATWMIADSSDMVTPDRRFTC
jgi:hypothetical protein